MLDRDSILKRQLIDCNCNDCRFMLRDLELYKKWEDWHRQIDLKEFEKSKAKSIKDALAIEDEKVRKIMLHKANKMKFQFDKSHLIQYGNCEKFSKPVSFIPETCQLETQDCFEHRRN